MAGSGWRWRKQARPTRRFTQNREITDDFATAERRDVISRNTRDKATTSPPSIGELPGNT
jgi:hypothetical protein